MTQNTMFSLEGVVDLGQLAGASGGRKLEVLGEAVYASKCFLPNRPYTLVNEVICAELATKLGLPIPARKYISYQNKLWFGLEWRPDHRNLTEQTLNNLINKDKIPGLLVFDVLVCNPDRHDGNILVQKVSPQLNLYTFSLIDHSHALVGTGMLMHFLATNKDTRAYLRHNRMLLSLIHDWLQFEDILRKVENLTEADIAEIVESVLSEWRPASNDISLLVPFIVQRKEHVRRLLLEAQDCFPNLVQRRLQ